MAYNHEMIAEARGKAELARKARAEGNDALARAFYVQAADRYKAAGMRLVAENVMRMAEGR